MALSKKYDGVINFTAVVTCVLKNSNVLIYSLAYFFQHYNSVCMPIKSLHPLLPLHTVTNGHSIILLTNVMVVSPHVLLHYMYNKRSVLSCGHTVRIISIYHKKCMAVTALYISHL